MAGAFAASVLARDAEPKKVVQEFIFAVKTPVPSTTCAIWHLGVVVLSFLCSISAMNHFIFAWLWSSITATESAALGLFADTKVRAQVKRQLITMKQGDWYLLVDRVIPMIGTPTKVCNFLHVWMNLSGKDGCFGHSQAGPSNWRWWWFVENVGQFFGTQKIARIAKLVIYNP